jgi:hypothetical protein
VVRNEDNTENPLVGDWVGIPLSEAGFARSEAWDASVQSLPEWQCRPRGWAYIYRGPTPLGGTRLRIPPAESARACRPPLERPSVSTSTNGRTQDTNADPDFFADFAHPWLPFSVRDHRKVFMGSCSVCSADAVVNWQTDTRRKRSVTLDSGGQV